MNPFRRQPNRAGRVETVLRWPLGLGLVSWRYLWRTTPMHRSETDGGPEDLPPPIPQRLLDDAVQQLAEGVGPLLHRYYAVCIEGSHMAPQQLLSAVTSDFNRVAPTEVATFDKTRGHDGELHLGDEFVVRMPGPWNGPVRVVRADEHAFQLATLRGHLEAGQIEFRTSSHDDGTLRFEIESWARAGDRLSHVLYNWIGLAKEIQLNMWTHVCLRSAKVASGRIRGGIVLRTRRVDNLPDLHVVNCNVAADGKSPAASIDQIRNSHPLPLSPRHTRRHH
jgi:hypothetical protein